MVTKLQVLKSKDPLPSQSWRIDVNVISETDHYWVVRTCCNLDADYRSGLVSHKKWSSDGNVSVQGNAAHVHYGRGAHHDITDLPNITNNQAEWPVTCKNMKENCVIWDWKPSEPTAVALRVCSDCFVEKNFSVPHPLWCKQPVRQKANFRMQF